MNLEIRSILGKNISLQVPFHPACFGVLACVGSSLDENFMLQGWYPGTLPHLLFFSNGKLTTICLGPIHGYTVDILRFHSVSRIECRLAVGSPSNKPGPLSLNPCRKQTNHQKAERRVANMHQKKSVAKPYVGRVQLEWLAIVSKSTVY